MRADRQAPHENEAEVSVLGGMLIDPEAAQTGCELLSEPAFHQPRHRMLFSAMQAIVSRGSVVDPTTLAAELNARRQLPSVGGMEYIAELLDAVPTAANLTYHAAIVRECWQRRQVIEAGTKIAHLGYEGGRPAAEIVDEAERLVLQCTDNTSSGLVSLRAALGPTFERLDALQNAPGGITGIPCGITGIDEMTGGFQKGDLIIVAARPSIGKTGMMTGFALHCGIHLNEPVAFFSIEMAKDPVVRRFLCHEAIVNLWAMNTGRLRDNDFTRLATAAAHLNKCPVWIDDSGANTVQAIRAACRRMKKENGLSLVVIDYLGMMQGEGENRNHEVGSITRGLKAMAKELDVPVVVGAQLNRQAANRSDHRPQLADLRDSGNIEQDADLVGFIHRPEYYMSDAEAKEQNLVGHAEFNIAKQRNGPTGVVELYFRKECARFEGPNWGNRAA